MSLDKKSFESNEKDVILEKDVRESLKKVVDDLKYLGNMWELGVEPDCGKVYFCNSYKSKMQGMIEILEDELKFLEAIKSWNSWDKMSIFAKKNFNNRRNKIQSDLIKLKEAVK